MNMNKVIIALALSGWFIGITIKHWLDLDDFGQALTAAWINVGETLIGIVILAPIAYAAYRWKKRRNPFI